MNYNYSFPAVRGKQAKSDYYICMIPCGLLSKLFIVDNDDIQPEYRAQRKINYTRIPEIKKYILDNRNSYVFSALAASIDGEFKFRSVDDSDLGVLEVNMNSTFLINDGQHRKTAIEEAILEDDSIADETIPVVFFKDKGLVRSQQMFTDLNKHAVNTSKSLNALYDSSDDIAILTRKVVDNISFFKMYTDKEKDTLGKFSNKLFTLNNFYNANKLIVENKKINDTIIEYVTKYWKSVVDSIAEWKMLMNKEITKKSLREEYIITQGVVLLALGMLGNYFFNNKQIKMEKYLKKLNNINWLRSNDEWHNRAIHNGKISRNQTTIRLTYIHIKELIGIELDQKEKDYEKAKME